VTGGNSAAELRRLLRRELRARLEPAGWSMVDARAGGPFTLVAFVRPIDEQFAATAEVEIEPSVPDRPPVLIREVSVGVSYEPLRRLWPLLGAFGAAVLQEAPAADGTTLFEVAAPADVARVADGLARPILDRAVPFARGHANLDGLLRSLRQEADPT
jgi:hypothetical protein